MADGMGLSSAGLSRRVEPFFHVISADHLPQRAGRRSPMRAPGVRRNANLGAGSLPRGRSCADCSALASERWDRGMSTREGRGMFAIQSIDTASGSRVQRPAGPGRAVLHVRRASPVADSRAATTYAITENFVSSFATAARGGGLCERPQQVAEEQILVWPVTIRGAAGHTSVTDGLLEAQVLELDSQAGAVDAQDSRAQDSALRLEVGVGMMTSGGPDVTITIVERLACGEPVLSAPNFVAHAADMLAVNRQTAWKWLRRFEAEGKAGLEDQPSAVDEAGGCDAGRERQEQGDEADDGHTDRRSRLLPSTRIRSTSSRQPSTVSFALRCGAGASRSPCAGSHSEPREGLPSQERARVIFPGVPAWRPTSSAEHPRSGHPLLTRPIIVASIGAQWAPYRACKSARRQSSPVTRPRQSGLPHRHSIVQSPPL